MSDAQPPDPLSLFHRQVVVIDTQGPLIYFGTLTHISDLYVILDEADIHDTNDSRASKDLYIVETRDLGVRVNRSRTLLMRTQIASISLLKDVIN